MPNHCRVSCSWKGNKFISFWIQNEDHSAGTVRLFSRRCNFPLLLSSYSFERCTSSRHKMFKFYHYVTMIIIAWRHWCRHKHLWRVLVIVQMSHVTLQHQWKIQLHLSLAVYCSVTWPRPQHIKSHPSTPIEVALHSRPLVPSQKLGELS